MGHAIHKRGGWNLSTGQLLVSYCTNLAFMEEWQKQNKKAISEINPQKFQFKVLSKALWETEQTWQWQHHVLGLCFLSRDREHG